MCSDIECLQKLNTYPGNTRAQKVLIAAKYAGVEVDVPAFNFGVDNNKPEYIAKYHTTAVPTFEGRHGEALFESNAIARFVASQTADGAQLLGSTPFEQALIASFTDLVLSELTPAIQGWLYPIQGWRAYDQAVYESSKKTAFKSLATFERILADRTYLVGESVTLADLALSTALINFVKMVRGLRGRTQSEYFMVGGSRRPSRRPKGVFRLFSTSVLVSLFFVLPVARPSGGCAVVSPPHVVEGDGSGLPLPFYVLARVKAAAQRAGRPRRPGRSRGGLAAV